MRADMHMDTVIEHLRNLKDQGENLSKKKVKEKYPRLMKNALYYFPSWEHALDKID